MPIRSENHGRKPRSTRSTSSTDADRRTRGAVERARQVEDAAEQGHEVEIERRDVKPTRSTSSASGAWRRAADRVEERDAEDIDSLTPRELARRFGRRR